MKRYKIERERSLPLFGQVRLDWSTKWAIAIICGLAMLAFVSSILNLYGLWLPVALVSLGFWLVFIVVPFAGLEGKSLLSWLYRKARHDMGEQVHLSDRVQNGESLFGSERQPQPKKFSKHLGRVDYIPYEVQEGLYIGIARDRREETYTVGLTVKIGSLLSDSSTVREARIAGFGALLNRVAKGGFHRFVWRTQIIPGEKIDLRHDVEVLQDDQLLSSHEGHDPSRFIEDYERLIGNGSCERLVTFFFTVGDVGRFRRQARKLEGGFSELLVQEVSKLVADLGLGGSSNAIGVKHVAFLGYNELLLEERMVLDPVFAVPVYRKSVLLESGKLFRESIAWPQACSFALPNHAIVGETVHTGFFIDSFPLEGVGPTDMSWLLNSNYPMTVTAVYHLVPRHLAFDRAVRASNSASGVVDEMLSGGKTPTEAQLLEAQQTKETQRQIAESQAEVVRSRVYVDLTGHSVESVESMVEKLRSEASLNGMPLARLSLRQEDGISVLLPTGRGMTSKGTSNWLTSVRS